MAETLRDVMTKNPVMLGADSSAADAARKMKDSDVGDILVTNGDRLHGIVTDRDLVVRCMAEGEDPKRMKLDRLCSKQLATLSPDSSIDEAIHMMRDKAIRRIPVVEGSKPIGVVSLGDLAQARDRRSALGEISAAAPNR